MVSYRDNDIAIIGISGRFPEADNLDAFWQNLAQGKDSVRAFPPGRVAELAELVGNFNTEDFVRGGYLSSISYFDPEYFNISPEEARYIDPQQRLLLELVDEAMNDAGYGGRLTGKKVGVFMSTSKNSYSTLIDPGMPMAMANIPEAALAGRIAYVFNFIGPTLTIDTACSSALTAIHFACQSIRTGECEFAVAGGARIMVLPMGRAILGVLPILSKKEQARAFDKDADGTTFGEGGAVILLKNLQKALKDGDPIHAIIKASAVNSDGARSNGLAAPNQDAQAEVITDVLERAGVDARTVSYIETHGTGTKLGDPIEVEGITRAFMKHTNEKQFIAISSLKTNIGHLDTVAGVAGLTKAVLALKHRQIPPSLHYDIPNPHIDFVNSPVYVNDHLTDWDVTARNIDVRRVGVTSLGLTGTNVHLLMEEAPARPVRTGKEAGGSIGSTACNLPEIVTLSANNVHSLQTMAQNLSRHIKAAEVESKDSATGIGETVPVETPDVAIRDIAYTLNTGRRHHNHRLIIIASDTADLAAKLDSFAQTDFLESEQTLQKSAKATMQGSSKEAVGKQIPGEQGLYGNARIKYGITKEDNLLRTVIFSPVFIFGDTVLKEEVKTEDLLTAFPTFKEKYNACLNEVQTMGRVEKNTRFFAFQHAYAELLTSVGISPKAVLGIGLGKCASDLLQGKTSLAKALTLAQESKPTAPVDESKLQNVITQMRKDGHNLFVILEGEKRLGSMIKKFLVDGENVLCLALDDSLETLQAGLVELYSNGCPLNWDALYVGRDVQRLNLPTYAFNRRSYLIQPFALKSAYRSARSAILNQSGSANTSGRGSNLAQGNDSVRPGIGQSNQAETSAGSTNSFSETIANATATPTKLATIEELLDLFQSVTGTTINLEDDFTANGADSIMVMQAVGLIKRHYEVTIPMDLFFTAASVKELVNQLVASINNSLMPESGGVSSLHDTAEIQDQTERSIQSGSSSATESNVAGSTNTTDDTLLEATSQSITDPAESASGDTALPLLSDAELGSLSVTVTEPQSIFLTGATGFLGAHLIPDLLGRVNTPIYCSVRGETTEVAYERLKERLNYYFGSKFDQYLGNRIIVVKSNLTEPALGLAAEEYAQLADRMDMVIHSAADVRHQGKYEEFEKNNVFTTKQVLDFTTTGRQKQFHHISTMAVVGLNLAHRVFDESNFYTGQSFRGNPYGRSKFEAEKLVYEARRRGLKASVYRVGNLVGRYSDGLFQPNVEANEIYNYLKAIVLLKRIPSGIRGGSYEITPIDLTSEALAKLVLAKEFIGHTYHLACPQHVTFGQMLDALNSTGYPIAEIEYEKFYRQVRNHMENNGFIRELGLLFNNLRAANDRQEAAQNQIDQNQERRESQTEHQPFRIDTDFTVKVLEKLGFTWPELDLPYLEKLLKYCETISYFPSGNTKTVAGRISRLLKKK